MDNDLLFNLYLAPFVYDTVLFTLSVQALGGSVTRHCFYSVRRSEQVLPPPSPPPYVSIVLLYIYIYDVTE